MRRLKKGDIAVVAHADLDPVAAEALTRCQVAAVVNTQPTLTGRFPTTGSLILLRHGVPIAEVTEPDAFEKLREGKKAILDLDRKVLVQDSVVFPIRLLSEAEVQQRLQEAERNLTEVLEDFAANTLAYLRQEGKRLLAASIPLPPLRTKVAGRPVLIVVRGHSYREDLLAIRSFIRDRRPVLIGVDGGADALLELGWRPDIILGDMDSVSEQALRSGAELVVHAYPDGRAPGLKRVRELGLDAHVFPIGGTSEDAAMLLAYEAGAELIVMVGSHASVVEFLEKGRQGMASTFLTRLRVGHKLVDAKGVSALYSSGIRWWHIFSVLVLGTLLGAWLIHLSPTLQTYLRPLWLWLRTSLEHGFR